MRQLFDFLMQRPILLFVLVAWIAGMIGNAAKAMRKARERAEAQRRMPPAGPPPVRTVGRSQAPGQASADDIAAEMRRILGMETVPRRTAPAPTPAPVRRATLQAERPPTPVLPTTQQRHIEIHVDPHVGESIGDRIERHSSAAATRRDTSSLGSLGGRVHAHRGRREAAHRFALDDLRTALVLNEILGPPLALRSHDVPLQR